MYVQEIIFNRGGFREVAKRAIAPFIKYQDCSLLKWPSW